MYPHNCPLCCVNVVQTTYVVERLSACTDTIPSPPSHSLKGWRHAKQCQEDDDVIYRYQLRIVHTCTHTSIHVYKFSLLSWFSPRFWRRWLKRHLFYNSQMTVAPADNFFLFTPYAEMSGQLKPESQDLCHFANILIYCCF